MEIRLGRINQTDVGAYIELDREISNQNHELLLGAIDELHFYESNLRLLEMIILNNNEFIELTKKSRDLIENSLSIIGHKENYYNHHLNLNRLFFNYLSSIRTFLDHIETKTKRKYGKDSGKSQNFKNITSYFFDTYFPYRFIYKLRNYSLHCGLPIDEVEVSVTKIAEDTFMPEYKIEFDSQELLANYSEWGKVKQDLMLKEKFSIFEIINDMIPIINELWQKIFELFEPELDAAILHLEEETGYLKEEDCSVCIFTNIVNNENGTLKYFHNRTIPFDIIDSLTPKE
jgi:hypothetical protein